ncbi:MAG: hypothetical protein GY871_02020 [Actinomycetales bacterium]|nr:hypothetical protein [Actinomycetales bacterium]
MILLLLACHKSADGLDSACDQVTGFLDADGDGFGGEGEASCSDQVVELGGDCDDADASVHPSAQETCNGIDDDCDGLADDDDDAAQGRTTWYADADQDGFGDPDVSTDACSAPSGYLADGSDCDDADAAAFPGAAETPYDGVDQDCDGADWDDLDGDGAALDDDCDDDDPARSWLHDEWCDDGVDNDCDGEVDSDCQFFGGVVDATPWQTVFGEKETVACCGGIAGSALVVGDVVDSGVPYLIMTSLYDGSDIAVMEFRPGQSDTSSAVGLVASEEYDEGAMDFAALSVADFDGDGVSDLVLGEPSTPGEVTVVSGPVTGSHFEGGSLAQIAGDDYKWGTPVVAGDADGDGSADLSIAAGDYGYSVGISVYLGPLSGAYTQWDRDYVIESGSTDWSTLGVAHTLADVDGDGVSDTVAVAGARFAGTYISPEVYVFSGPIVGDLSTDDADMVIEASGYQRLDDSPPALIGGEDLDGDGYQDVTMLASGSKEGDQHNAVWICSDLTAGGQDLGNADVRVDLWQDVVRPQVEVLDMNGDGNPDLAVSDPYQGGDGVLDGPGRVHLFLGPLAGTYSVDDADGWLEGEIAPFESCETDGCEHPGSLFGWSLENAGDVDSDGFEDLVVGSPGHEHDTSSNMKGPGAVYVFRGGGGF